MQFFNSPRRKVPAYPKLVKRVEFLCNVTYKATSFAFRRSWQRMVLKDHLLKEKRGVDLLAYCDGNDRFSRKSSILVDFLINVLTIISRVLGKRYMIVVNVIFFSLATRAGVY